MEVETVAGNKVEEYLFKGNVKLLYTSGIRIIELQSFYIGPLHCNFRHKIKIRNSDVVFTNYDT